MVVNAAAIALVAVFVADISVATLVDVVYAAVLVFDALVSLVAALVVADTDDAEVDATSRLSFWAPPGATVSVVVTVLVLVVVTVLMLVTMDVSTLVEVTVEVTSVLSVCVAVENTVLVEIAEEVAVAVEVIVVDTMAVEVMPATGCLDTQ